TLVVAIMAPEIAPTMMVAGFDRGPLYRHPVHITTTKSTIITVISMIILIPITKTSISKQQLCT
ncbi:MAG: hypothetical protein ACK55Z_19720, partial [bacterium]